jgi:fumarate hydratase class II
VALERTAVERFKYTCRMMWVAEYIAEFTGHPFVTAENKFEALAAHINSWVMAL